MKRFILSLLSSFAATPAVATSETAYDFTFEALMSDTPIQLSDYRGSVIMVVNTASNCGFTQQYKQLEALYQRYKDRGFVVIGVPSNDFGNQEPGSNQEIAAFCEFNYGVTFPMAAKQQVKGKNAHPLYPHAREVLGFGSSPKWNFHKYLINKNGDFVDYFYSTTKPNAPKIISKIEALLAE